MTTTRRRPSEIGASLAPLGVALVASSALTVAVAVDDSLRFAYRNDELRVAVETAVALMALVVGAMAVVRFRTTRDLSDALVAVAVFVIAYGSLFYGAIPMLFDDPGSERFAVWAPLAARTIAAALLAVAPWAGGRHVGTRSATQWVGLTAAVVVGLGVALALVPELPTGLSVMPDIDDSSRPQFRVTDEVAVLQAVNVAFFLTCAVGSLRRRSAADDPDDGYWRWIAVGAVFQAASRAHFVLFPSLYSDWFYTGDVLRLAGYVAWLAAATSEVRRITSDRARLAVLDERRRMARELHDGLVQDLSFIHSQVAGARTPTPEMMEHVATSANRALREARLAVAALSDTDEMPPEISLRAAAERIAGPAGVAVTCSFQPDAVVPAEIRHDLARIVQEAATNAVKHAQATSIAVELDCPPTGGLWLMIADDGTGFDTSTPSNGGFGLISMRQRAERIGGRLTLQSEPGQGTVVEVQIDARKPT